MTETQRQTVLDVPYSLDSDLGFGVYCDVDDKPHRVKGRVAYRQRGLCRVFRVERLEVRVVWSAFLGFRNKGLGSGFMVASKVFRVEDLVGRA